MTTTSQVRLKEQRHTRSFASFGVRSGAEVNLDPFLNIDLFEMSEPTFPPHPHAGFSAVTYLLPESVGTFQNRDSLGDQSLIKPGDIHWTQAGSGMLHEEIPVVRGLICKGFQIFVNLSEEKKLSKPVAFHATRSELPTIETDSGKIVVVAGKYQKYSSPLGPLASEVDILDCTVKKGFETSLLLTPEHSWFLFGISGSAQSLGGPNLTEHQVTTFGSGSQQLIISSPQSDFRFLLCGGKPVGEPVVWGGPFVMTTIEAVRQAHLRYSNGEMGHLSRSF